MNRRTAIQLFSGLTLSSVMKASPFRLEPQTGNEPIMQGPFLPTWESLEKYQTPAWFRDAKFGIWAHWGPQCQPEFGDWYAREMYIEGSKKADFHRTKYGHPSKFGFKDVINEWKAVQWNPDELLALYKKAGAEYFVALANHHDNLDLYKSKYQSWNSLRVGPKKDIIGAWAKAAKKQGLHFGVSVHAAHAWSWYEPAQRADKEGAMKGVPYDGKLTKEEGKGLWWEGLDPQELYAQNHPLSEHSENNGQIHKQWHWGNGVAKPSQVYCDKFMNRTIDLINKYDPDLIYFDDTALPLWPASDVGLKIAAHYYNKSVKKNGKVDVVINGKILDEQQRKTMVWDIERGQTSAIEPLPWQTCTCIGDWHYNRTIVENHAYRKAKAVIQALVDVVSKNGNLLLSVPVRADGTIDEDERAIVEEIGAWMAVNKESIVGTRPWKIFGEGPSSEKITPLNAQGFNEGKTAFTADDIRFVQKDTSLFVTFFGWPATDKICVKALSLGNELYPNKINSVRLLGGTELTFERRVDGLYISLPSTKSVLDYANVVEIS